MERKGARTFVGDLNCHCNGKDRVLKEWIEQEELMDIGTAMYTHRWGAHRCVIDRALTRSSARTWAIDEEWDHTSDHAIVGTRLQRADRRRVLRRTDWTAVEKYIKEEGERSRPGQTDALA